MNNLTVLLENMQRCFQDYKQAELATEDRYQKMRAYTEAKRELDSEMSKCDEVLFEFSDGRQKKVSPGDIYWKPGGIIGFRNPTEVKIGEVSKVSTISSYSES